MGRWYSHTPCGQAFAQIFAQWTWNIRLERGQQLAPTELRTTEFAPAHEVEKFSANILAPEAVPTPPVTYGLPQWAYPLLRMASLVLRLLCSLMARCGAPPII
ncbi:hypothetical protein EPA93_01105 [Ktedonosporobacter rubrisoli]|uniref:Uncharacterized protein n=1 Tax=Ktedonosporobacter rubrisoli TaxID=2509675 RepID=A0A4V0YY17_KTERU|nr:hypothetical protein [Ktedonosporobacter rubrisoli]QBD74661.1 hypothetical protein EPA93_01105 [Ktedonosporobacter rubrisoli]